MSSVSTNQVRNIKISVFGEVMMAISFLCGQIKIILFVENSKEKCSTLPSIPDHNHSSHVELNVHAYWCLILIKLYKTLKVNLYYLIIFDGNL